MRNDRLRFDVMRLEHRMLLAGDVTAVLTAAGDLKITGDDQDNDFNVFGVDADTVEVEPLGSTRINGLGQGQSAFFDRDSFRTLRINGKGGDDSIDVGSAAGYTIFRNGQIVGGGGNDDIEVDGARFDRSLRIHLSGGEAQADTIANGVDQRVRIRRDVTVASNLVVKGSATDDLIEVHGDSLAGNHTLILGKTTIAVGGGDDQVSVVDIVAGNDFKVQLGSGDDGVQFDHSSALGRVTFNGGPGVDFFDVSFNTFSIPPMFRSFP